MAKRVIVIVLLLVLALFVYVGYNTYDTKRTGASGEVYSNGVARASAPDTKTATSDADAVVYPSAADTQASTQQPANGATTLQPTPTTAQANAPQANTQVTQSQQQPAAGTVPATDTISPNPPNGMTFAGSGRYQLYRQGNITWRLDTETGRSCVIFATDEEWRKPRVYRAGCGKS
jgi:cytoskeletal protein RodZ